MWNNQEKDDSLIYLLILFVLNGILGALFWPYVFEKWYCFFGRPIDMKMWHGFIIGLVPYIGGWHIPAAIVTYVIFFLFLS